MSICVENVKTLVFGGRGKKLQIDPHLHNSVEVFYMLSGKSTAEIDGKKYKINPGEAFIVFPNCIHSYISDQSEDYLLFIIDMSILAGFKDTLQSFIPENPIIHNAMDLLPLFKKIEDEKKLKDDYSLAILFGYCNCLIGEILRNTVLNPKKSGDTESRIIAYCMENYSKNISLETVSKELYISKSHLSHIFSQNFGISFRKYINILRINEVCYLLRNTNNKIADVSVETGFGDVRTLNRVFLSLKGISPKQYRIKKSDI